MILPKIQYISQGNTEKEQLENIQNVLSAGAQWIQLRWKNASEEAFLSLAFQIKKCCQMYGATLIINDHPHIAWAVDADGVHLGLEDSTVLEARKLLGISKIIGGTANTYEDVIQRIHEKCDYIGLGPFQFTATKEKLSPVLGIQGYQQIFEKLNHQKLQVPPIFAIGGIDQKSLHDLQKTGVYGFACSGELTHQPKIYPTLLSSFA